MFPLPLPDDQGRIVILARNGMIPPHVKVVDVIRANFMMIDILLEENDRLVICGSVNMMDHDKSSLAFMAQMTPALGKKMTTLFQVTFAEPPLAINCPEHCYIFKGTLRCIESLEEICSADM
jgi:menaquinone-dependent protoporphyrinogen IX oxidase